MTAAPVGTITCTLTLAGTLAQNAALAPITITVRPVANGTNPNQAAVAAVAGETNTVNNTVNDPTTVTAAAVPDIAITKVHSGTFTAGQNAQYNITVTNQGSANSSTSLTVTDTLPASLTLTSASGGGWTCDTTLSPLQCKNDAPHLQPNTSLLDLTLVVKVAGDAIGSLSNTATVTQPTGDSNTASRIVAMSFCEPRSWTRVLSS